MANRVELVGRNRRVFVVDNRLTFNGLRFIRFVGFFDFVRLFERGFDRLFDAFDATSISVRLPKFVELIGQFFNERGPDAFNLFASGSQVVQEVGEFADGRVDLQTELLELRVGQAKMFVDAIRRPVVRNFDVLRRSVDDARRFGFTFERRHVRFRKVKQGTGFRVAGVFANQLFEFFAEPFRFASPMRRRFFRRLQGSQKFLRTRSKLFSRLDFRNKPFAAPIFDGVRFLRLLDDFADRRNDGNRRRRVFFRRVANFGAVVGCVRYRFRFDVVFQNGFVEFRDVVQVVFVVVIVAVFFFVVVIIVFEIVVERFRKRVFNFDVERFVLFKRHCLSPFDSLG